MPKSTPLTAKNNLEESTDVEFQETHSELVKLIQNIKQRFPNNYEKLLKKAFKTCDEEIELKIRLKRKRNDFDEGGRNAQELADFIKNGDKADRGSMEDRSPEGRENAGEKDEADVKVGKKVKKTPMEIKEEKKYTECRDGITYSLHLLQLQAKDDLDEPEFCTVEMSLQQVDLRCLKFDKYTGQRNTYYLLCLLLNCYHLYKMAESLDDTEFKNAFPKMKHSGKAQLLELKKAGKVMCRLKDKLYSKTGIVIALYLGLKIKRISNDDLNGIIITCRTRLAPVVEEINSNYEFPESVKIMMQGELQI